MPSAGLLDDLYSFDPATMTWTLLSAKNDTRRPSARYNHGFTSAGGLLYVHGGSSYNKGDADAVSRGLLAVPSHQRQGSGGLLGSWRKKEMVL